MGSMKEILRQRRFTRSGPGALLIMLLVSMVGITTTAEAHSPNQKTVNMSKMINAPYLYCQRVRGDGDLCSRSWWRSHKAIRYSISPKTYIQGNKVKVRVYYASYERGGDRTRFTSTRTYTVYTAPAGWRLVGVSGPRGYSGFNKRGGHAGRSFRAPWSFARGIGCYSSGVRIWGDTHGVDYAGQGYQLRFPLKVVLQKAS